MEQELSPINIYMYVKDEDLNRVFKKVVQINQYSEFTYEENYIEKNTFTLKLPRTTEETKIFVTEYINVKENNGLDGTMIIVENSKNKNQVGIVTDFEDTSDGVVLSGHDLFGIFESFVASPKGVVSDSQPKEEKISVIDKVATECMKEYITRCFIVPDEPRILPIFSEWFEIVIEDDFGDIISMYGRFEDVYSSIQQELEANSIGIRIEFNLFDLKPFKIFFYKGVDIPSANLSTKNGGLLDYKYTVDISSTINSCYALGADDGSEREVVRFEKIALIGSQGEGAVDARDVDKGDTAGLINRAKSTVEEAERITIFSATYNQDNEAFILDKDFFLGDRVIFGSDFFETIERINKVTTTHSQTDGKKIDISIEKTLTPFNKQFRKLSKRITKIEYHSKLT